MNASTQVKYWIIQHFSLRLYIRLRVARLQAIRKAGPAAGGETRKEFDRRITNELHEFYEWGREVDDMRLVKRAGKIGIYLDEIQFEKVNDEDNIGLYYRNGNFGTICLRDEFRGPLQKAVREREPLYRKEKREFYDLCVRVMTGLAGLIGTVIGLIAILKK